MSDALPEELTRALAASPEAARYVSHRPALAGRLERADRDSLRERGDELVTGPIQSGRDEDLEGFLDDLRLLRRDEMVFAACLGFGGLASPEQVSTFLCVLAEHITRAALSRASSDAPPLSVVGMGKIAGGRLTYHSDLDVIFIYEGAAELALAHSRTAQRLIAYLSTMTGAGVAYAIDARLRPSGRQGALVTTMEAFGDYQARDAALWEHLALMRARVIAGESERAQPALDALRARVSGRGESVWPGVADMHQRVIRERGREKKGAIPLKAGRGGLMQFEFLATGALLEKGSGQLGPAAPATLAMLERCAPANGRSAQVQAAYALLCEVEACARWRAGRAVESVPSDAASLDLIADLVEPGLSSRALLERLEAARNEIATAFEAVTSAHSIDAL